MAIAMSKTREQYPLSTKKVLKKTLAGTFIWSILLLVICIPLSIVFATSSTGLANYLIPAAIGVIFFLLIIIVLIYSYQWWYYNVYFYDLTPDYIVIKKGPITPREITIPYERIQDIYVDQDILDRLFGLYDVHLSSATISSGMEAHIDGVEKPAADGLRQLLLQTVGDRISKNRPQANPPQTNPVTPA